MPSAHMTCSYQHPPNRTGVRELREKSTLIPSSWPGSFLTATIFSSISPGPSALVTTCAGVPASYQLEMPQQAHGEALLAPNGLVGQGGRSTPRMEFKILSWVLCAEKCFRIGDFGAPPQYIPCRAERLDRGWIFSGTFSWSWLSWWGLATRQLPASLP